MEEGVNATKRGGWGFGTGLGASSAIFLYAELMQILGAPNEKKRAPPPKRNIARFLNY